jgi:hypothetical protein
MVFLTVTVLLLTVTLLLVMLAGPAEAYVDPGTGSMLMQFLVGGIMAGLFLLRSTWKRGRAWFHRRPADPADKAE